MTEWITKNITAWETREESNRSRTRSHKKTAIGKKKNLAHNIVYRASHKKELAANNKNYRITLRRKTLDHYGGKCACCGETTYEFLAIDHVNGGGLKHRKTMRSSTIYTWIKKNNYPDGFQVLCHNCNSAKGFYGYCPHQKVEAQNETIRDID